MKDIYIPIFCENESKFDVSTLVLDTIRIGFPNSRVHIYMTGRNSIINERIIEKASILDNCWLCHNKTITTNSQLIATIIDRNFFNSFIVLDQDVIFWENCEDIEYDGLLTGRFIPKYACPYTHTITMPRLHPSFLVFNNVEEIKNRLKEFTKDPLVPFDAISPTTVFIEKTQLFFDVCSNLYQCIGGNAFQEDILKRYDHLGCSTFIEKVEDKCPRYFKGSTEFQRDIKNRMLEAKGLWKKQDMFYANYAI